MSSTNQAWTSMNISRHDIPEISKGTHFLVDKNGKLMYIDKMCENIFNVRPDECLGMIDFSTLQWVHSKDRNKVRENFQSAINDDTSSKIEYNLAGHDGITLSHTLFPIHDNEGELVSIHGFFEKLQPGNFLVPEKNNAFETLELFNQISLIVSKEKTFEKTLSELLDKVLELTKMESGGIYILNRETGSYILTAHSTVSEEFLQKHSEITREWKSLLPVIDEGKVVVIPDMLAPVPYADTERKKSAIDEGIRSFAGIPLISENSINGILMISYPGIHEFTETEKRLFSIIGRQLGNSIKQANLIEQLHKSQEMYRDLFDNAADVIYTHDMEGNMLSMNKTGLDTLLLDKKDILRLNIRDFLTVESLEVAQYMMSLITQGEDIRFPVILEVIRADGARSFIEFNIRPILEDGKPVAVHGIARDIDRRLKAEQNILIFNKALNLTSDGINVSDADHNITFINEAGSKMFGYKRMELIGQHSSIFYAEEDMSNFTENIIPAMEKYGYWNGLILGRKKDGTVFPVEVTLNSMMDEKGEPMVNLAIFRKRNKPSSEIYQ
ncbi:MAG: PAS domain S-box protein [Methanosarcinales archaeon]|nr:PAS domain S-box protein [Methanosarcinales archaeon]